MASAEWTIENNIMSIEGVLTRDVVPAIWKELKQWKPETEQMELSLQNTQRIDSAGMVMLIHLIQHAKISGCHIMLCFVPDQLKMLFQLSNIENMMVDHIKT